MNSNDKSPNAVRDPRWLVAICMLGLAIYFAIASFDGLHAYFSGDDGGNLMKMHQYFRYSIASVAGASLRVVSGSYRPLGGLFYFLLYRLFGYNPLPFRIVCLLIAMVNVLLAFSLLRRLSGSLLAGLLGAVLMVHHPVMLELLYSSGTIYEILCFFFYFLAVLLYFIWRQAGQAAGRNSLSWPQTLAILALSGGALDSKEMAMTLPAALFLLEAIYFRPVPWNWSAAFRQIRVVLLTGVLAVSTIGVKVLTKNPLSDDTRYHSHSVAATLDAMRGYHHFLLYGMLSSDGLPTAGLLVLWLIMAFLAFRWRSRGMQFGLLFVIVGLMPVCLIFPRGGYMAYIPLLGWALYLGCLFEQVMDDIVRGLHLGRFGKALKLTAFAAVALLIIQTHAERVAPYAGYWRDHQTQMRAMIDRLRTVHPNLPRGSKLLLVDDPAEPGYEMMFLTQLAYHDPALELDRTKMLSAVPTGKDLTHYDIVMSGGWKFHDVRGVADARPPVAVQTGPDGAAQIPEFAGHAVDLLTPGGQVHSVLDASGRAVANGAHVRWVRPEGGDWMAAQ